MFQVLRAEATFLESCRERYDKQDPEQQIDSEEMSVGDCLGLQGEFSLNSAPFSSVQFEDGRQNLAIAATAYHLS